MTIVLRTLSLSRLFIKEQLKEPIAFFWIMISPCALFYFFSITRQDEHYFLSDYTSASTWFYAYISSSVALFGFAFYIIGRRESGFIRSFIYARRTKAIFIASHFLAYSFIAMLYCISFYLVTRLPFGDYVLMEMLTIAVRFYVCFFMFCGIGAVFTLLPIGFQNSNTLLSIFSFCMLIIGMIGVTRSDAIIDTVNLSNPLTLATHIMETGLANNLFAVFTVVLSTGVALFGLHRYLRINPVWSRY